MNRKDKWEKIVGNCSFFYEISCYESRCDDPRNITKICSYKNCKEIEEKSRDIINKFPYYFLFINKDDKIIKCPFCHCYFGEFESYSTGIESLCPNFLCRNYVN